MSAGLATAAGALMAFGPTELRSLAADLALALAAAAFGLWRVGVALERRLARSVAPAAPLTLGAEALAHAQGTVLRAAADAPSFEAALLETAAALRGELGARATRVYLLCSDAGRLAVSELIAECPGFRAPARALAPADALLERAAREQRPCLDLPRFLALPVLGDGVPAALLELIGFELTIDEAALDWLLAAARAALEERAARPAGVQTQLAHRVAPDVRPFAPPIAFAAGGVPC
jgi:hypothetical protein